jgi:LytS/YehU family sensor histidine kinase
MLLQPYVENAIKHGIRNLADGNGFVSIDFTKTVNTLSCRIDDNGVGRKAAEKINAGNLNYHSSVGLSLMGKREEIFGISCRFVDKKDDNGKSSGTTVVLEIPLHYI